MGYRSENIASNDSEHHCSSGCRLTQTVRASVSMGYSLLACIGLLVATALAQTPAEPRPAVTVVTVQTEDIAQSIEFIGRIEAIEQVDVRARVQGFLEDGSFREGQDVKQGEVFTSQNVRSIRTADGLHTRYLADVVIE